MPSRDIERAALAVKRRILRLAIRFVVLDLAEQRQQLGVRPTVATETRPVVEVRCVPANVDLCIDAAAAAERRAARLIHAAIAHVPLQIGHVSSWEWVGPRR